MEFPDANATKRRTFCRMNIFEHARNLAICIEFVNRKEFLNGKFQKAFDGAGWIIGTHQGFADK